MKVILLQKIDKLGDTGDVKEVSEGYARNYLLPKGLVTPATPSALANLQQHIAAENRRREKYLTEVRETADKISKVSLTFAVKAGKEGRLYGSVTTQDIAAALREQEGIAVDRRNIQLENALRALGTYQIPVRLLTDIEPALSVTVTAIEEKAEPKAKTGKSKASTKA